MSGRTTDAGGGYCEISFPHADKPYLVEAALRRRFGDGALGRAWVIPSGDGPTLLVSRYLLEDSEIRTMLRNLQGEVVDDGSKPAGGRLDRPRSGLGLG